MDNESDNLATLLERAYEAMVDRLHARLEMEGYGEIKPSHGVIFQHIGADGARLTQLADRAGTSKQLMQYLVDPLERAGYLERVDDPTGGRAKIVRITPRGWKAVEVAEAALREAEVEFAELIGATPVAAIRHGLELLVTRLAADAQPTSSPGVPSHPARSLERPTRRELIERVASRERAR